MLTLRNSHCGKDSTFVNQDPGGTFTGGGGNSGGMTYGSPYPQSPISDGNAGSLGCNGGSTVTLVLQLLLHCFPMMP